MMTGAEFSSKRIAAKLTQAQLGNKLDKSRQTIASYEKMPEIPISIELAFNDLISKMPLAQPAS